VEGLALVKKLGQRLNGGKPPVMTLEKGGVLTEEVVCGGKKT